MDDDLSALAVGFMIEADYAVLQKIQEVMGSTEMKVLQEAKAIEAATKGMISPAATLQISAFGSAATTELRAVARETASAEKSGESLARQLQREADAFGLTRDQMRAAKVETAALRAEKSGLTELAQRLRDQLAALTAQQQAAATASSTSTEALAKLRAQYNPLFAIGQQYKNQVEGIKSAHALGAISASEMADALARAKAQASGGVTAFRSHGSALDRVTSSAAANRQAMLGASYQVQDFMTQVSMGANPINAFAVQSAQLAGQFSQVEGKAGAVARFFMGPWGMAITGAIMLAGMFTKDLFKSAEAMEKVASQSYVTGAAQSTLGQMFDLATGKVKNNTQALRDNIYAQMIAQQQQAILSRTEAQKALKDGGLGAASGWDRAKMQLLNPFEKRHETEARMDQLTSQRNNIQKILQGVISGSLSLEAAGTAATAAFEKGMLTQKQYFAFQDSLIKGSNSRSASEAARLIQEGLTGSLPEGLLNPNAPDKPKTDKAAESIAREVESLQTKIKSLHALAAAYGVSDVAALRAEATMRAHEKAIRKKTEIDKFVEDELRRTAAERVAATAKAAADMNHQTRLQKQVNDMVRAGTLDVSHMTEAYNDLASQRDILAALDLAKELGKPEEIAAAQKALNDFNQAQKDANKLRRETQDLQRSKELRDEIAQMQKLNEVTATHRQARLDILFVGNGGFEQDQALARANAESEKALILTRARADAEKALKQGLLDTASAVMEKARADMAAVDADLGHQTAEEAFRRLQDAANGLDLATPFGRAGTAVRGMIDAMDDLRDAQAAHRALVQQAGGDATKIARADALYQNAKVASTMKQIGAAKSLFKENSAGYKAMAAAEKAYAMYQLANTAINVAAGAAKMFASLGPWAFPVVAAMVGVMAGLGFRGGKGSASAPPSSPEELQAQFGTGTVYGNSSAQSESLSRALDILSANSNSDLEYSNEMLRTLRSIDGGIGQLAGNLGAQIGLGAAGMFDTSSLRVGTSGSSGFLGLFGSSTTRSLYDQGIQIYSQSIDRILAGQFNAQVYSVIQQVKKKSGFLGIGGGTSTSYSTTTNAINQDVKTAFADIIRSVSSGVVGVLAQYDVQMAANLRTAMLAFKLPAIKFSTQGMNGEEIENALNAYFSSVADQLSGLAAKQLPVLNELQKNGEGMFETLARVIKTFGGVNIGLTSIGMGGYGSSEAGLKGAAQLTDLFGDLGGFQEATSKYADKFLTEAERMAPIAAAVREEMARLGMAGVTTNDQFKAMVSGLNLSTEAGREAFAALMVVAPAFAKVTDYLGDLNNTIGESAEIAKKRRDLEIQIMELQGRSAEALAARREKELLALEETLRPLQLYIYALQDEATAKAQLKTAYERESQDIIKLRDKFADLGTSMREYRDSLLPQVSSGNAYARAMAEFQTAADAAKLGDADAMGKLSGMGQNLLTLSSENARSQIEYLRAVAMVKQGLDGAIFAADEAVDYQQEQLDALEAIVSNHLDLNENIIRVADAIEAIEAAQSGILAIGASMGSIPTITAVTNINNDNVALLGEITELNSKIDRLTNAAERGANASEKTDYKLSRVVDNDALATRERD